MQVVQSTGLPQCSRLALIKAQVGNWAIAFQCFIVKVCFFQDGCDDSNFHFIKHSCNKHLFMMVVIGVVDTSEHSFTNFEGMG